VIDYHDMIFSQNALQDYLDCPRRFELRYLQQMPWPAAETSDQRAFEEHQRQGNDLHRLIEQMVAGVSDEVLVETIADPQVRFWWDSFRMGGSDLEPVFNPPVGAIRLAEHTLLGRLGEWRIQATYDLLVIQPGQKVWIYDWKTTKSALNQEKLAQKIQTRLYPLLVVQAGCQWNHGQVWPAEQVEMVYWMAANPHRPIRFPYHASQYQKDIRELTDLMDEISHLSLDDFPLTEDKSRCRFCTYRSYCDRGTVAGNQDDFDRLDEDLVIDLSNVEPVDY
jgi:hypothetical protein